MLYHSTILILAAFSGLLSADELTRGRWIFDAGGKPVPPRAFERGLQTSGLVSIDGVLWSVGDQRSEYPGHLFRIDTKSARLIGKPIKVTTSDANRERFKAFAGVRNPDLEGLAAHPRKKRTLLAVTEDKSPGIAEIRLTFAGEDRSTCAAELVALAHVTFPAGTKPYRGDPNYRLEGLTISARSGTVYLAYERLASGRPALFKTTLDAVSRGGDLTVEAVDVDFASVAPRADKERARLNINGLSLFEHEKRELIVAVARDQERLLLIDPEKGRVTRSLDLQLRSPEGETMLWVSPEGVAADAGAGKIWVVNDPDSIRGNYRVLADESARGHFANLAPQLFEVPLGKLLAGSP